MRFLILITVLVLTNCSSLNTSSNSSHVVEEVYNADPMYADRSRGEWTLVVIPDTQHYSQDRDNAPIRHMRKAFDWIVSMKDHLNIKMVQGLGDITESWNSDWEWQNAYSAWSKLDGIVTYMPIAGNHDSKEKLNRYFPASKFYNDPSFAEHEDSGIENNYFLMTIGKEDYLFLHIEPYTQYQKYDPKGVIFAREIIKYFPNRKVILATHDNWETSYVRENLMYKFDNIVMANSGHSCDREQLFETFGPAGGKTYNFITDYQCDDNEVMLIRYYIFKPMEDKVTYYTYSPITDEFEWDYSSQGDIEIYQNY